MCIDLYAHWKNQTEDEKEAQLSSWHSTVTGGKGYLREAYHGEPYATRFLCREAFDTGEALIPATVLRERLPHTLTLVGEREQKLYGAHEERIMEVKRSFCDFVALCEDKERETGEPVKIVAWF